MSGIVSDVRSLRLRVEFNRSPDEAQYAIADPTFFAIDKAINMNLALYAQSTMLSFCPLDVKS